MAEILTILAAAVITLYLATRKGSTPAPKFTIVKNERDRLDSEDDRALYDSLTRNGYYVSCRVHSGSAVIPLALEPYRIAVLPSSAGSYRRVFMKYYLRKSGWKVVCPADPESCLKKIHKLIAGQEEHIPASAGEQKPS
ncbi:hypothetical protein [Alteribacter natronophilus]|uniref:hypothetical protein n=1 Tax=Alteribacter natronophilus TaxID=2583810 RepID=UPI00110D78BE|nr:hypothetical protein [Alteribacter natronophilus]TMW71626.1 hypothetical protein FGB90_11375 [Alteribacter natronophilus]